MRNLMIAASALLLAACGGEKYPVSASQAYSTLASVGTPAGLYPLPGPLEKVSVRFEAVPGGSAVQWLFSHDGDDLGRIVATVAPSGDKESAVTIEYVEGTAPDANWHNGDVRKQLKSSVRELVAEAVDSSLENRPFDMALRNSVEATVTAALIGGVMSDVATRMKDEMRRADEYENDPVTIERRRRLLEQATQTREHDMQVIEAHRTGDMGKPTTDLSKYH